MESARPAAGDLVGLSEIHDLLVRVTREFVEQLTCGGDVPEPAAELIGGAIWFREDVEAWIDGHGDVLANLFKAHRSARRDVSRPVDGRG
jgi:hypothetical protein